MPTIKELRTRRNWTQTQLAIKAHVSYPIIWKLETGQRVSRNSLARVCEVLGVKEEEIELIPNRQIG